jgi:hypothetical protein
MSKYSERYLVYALGSLFDWSVAIAAYVLINHLTGWILIGLAAGGDISRGIGLIKLEKAETQHG